jgi:hypothetical protein
VVSACFVVYTRVCIERIEQEKRGEEEEENERRKRIRNEKDAAAQPYTHSLVHYIHLYSQGVHRKERRHSHTDALLHTSHN